MQIDSAESLIDALRASGLFNSEQLKATIADLRASSGDIQTLFKLLIQKKHLTSYQVRKVIIGKASELVMGPYIITEKLGEGGMGKVFRARQVRLDREVALKVVRANLLSNQLVKKRYEREVETASSLHHPNIVGVFDAGNIDGKYYLAMEFVDGIDLSRLMRDYKPLEIAEACEYARQAALGLQYAHEQGFVHRDIKPSNIIVSGERHVPQATEPAVVKILDMGLVRNVGFDDGGGGGDLTRAGTVVGTPDYMAPEQAKNSSGVDHRADLYSLGCTLYFLLTGQPPFPSGTPIEKLLKHQLDSPVPLQALRPDVPSRVAEIVSRLTAKKPELRYQSAAEAALLLGAQSLYPTGTPAVASYVGQKTPPAIASEVLPQYDQSTIPPAASSGSTIDHDQTVQQPLPPVQPVAPSDHTPRPRGLPTALHASVENNSPFSSLTEEPNSGPLPAVPAVKEQRSAPVPTWRKYLWPWIVLCLLIIVAIGIGLFSSNNTKYHEQTPPEPAPASTSSATVKPPVRPGITPTINFSRFRPWTDLIVNDPALVAIVYSSTYLREKDSPYCSGSGPGKLGAWVEHYALKTGLSLSRSERIVYSIPTGSPTRFLLASEGDYLTPSYGTLLSGNSNLRPPKNTAKNPSPARFFSTATNLQTALIPYSSGANVYAVSSNQQLMSHALSHLHPESTSSSTKLDGKILTAINAMNGDSPPLISAVAGPGFQFPFAPQSPSKENLTLKEFGLDLLTIQIQIRDRLEIELTLLGQDEKAVRDFLVWLKKKIADEYPRDGGIILTLLSKAEQSKQTTEGKFRLTLKAAATPEQWSTFLEKLLG